MLLHFLHTTASTPAAVGSGSAVRIGDGPDGVSAALADLFHLQRMAESGPSGVGDETLFSLRDLMIESPLAEKRQGLFLFREAAQILASVVANGKTSSADASFEALRAVLEKAAGFARRTAAEALGGLPHGIEAPRLPPEDVRTPPEVSWRRLQQIAGTGHSSRPVWIGRSLVSRFGPRRLLVCASYFRNLAPYRVGTGVNGAPVDVRHLFDPELLHDTVLEIFSKYYRGITGTCPDFPLPVDMSKLVARMIEEMGVDRHMEEILRKVDQDQMSEDGFRRFLQERGHGHIETARGAEDIVLRTGPHLGAFNDAISLPELIAAVEAFSGLCVAGRFRNTAGSIRLM